MTLAIGVTWCGNFAVGQHKTFRHNYRAELIIVTRIGGRHRERAAHVNFRTRHLHVRATRVKTKLIQKGALHFLPTGELRVTLANTVSCNRDQ